MKIFYRNTGYVKGYCVAKYIQQFLPFNLAILSIDTSATVAKATVLQKITTRVGQLILTTVVDSTISTRRTDYTVHEIFYPTNVPSHGLQILRPYAHGGGRERFGGTACRGERRRRGGERARKE